MKIELIAAMDEDQMIVEKLDRSSFVRSQEGTCIDPWSSYWKTPGNHPFLIKIDHEISGFAVIQGGTHPLEPVWALKEFSMAAPFEGKQISARVVEHIFAKFPGKWEVEYSLEDPKLVSFWQEVLDDSQGGLFGKVEKRSSEGKEVLTFFSTGVEHPKNYEFFYQNFLSSQEEESLLQIISNQAWKSKEMRPIESFAFLIKDLQGTVIGGAKGATLYGCLYIDLISVDPEHQRRGIGRKLVRRCEDLGRERKCTFSTVSTMDWEALGFYQKLGYGIEYVREGYEKESKMYFLRKAL